MARSDCRTVCGDGIVSPDEECDDGMNRGGYGECSTDCKLEEYCGDGVVQEAYEDCDDGNTRDGDECSRICYWPLFE